MPERYGSWKSVYDRFRRWGDDGTIERILDRLRLTFDRDGCIDWDMWCVDGSNVRAHPAAAGASEVSKNRPNEPLDHALGRSCGGWGSKIHLVTYGTGVPLAATVTAEQAHESRSFETVMNAVRPDAQEAAVGAGRQGLQLPACATMVRASRHLGCDPAAVGSTRSGGSPRLQPVDLQEPKHGGALRGLAQAQSPLGHTLREAGLPLPRRDQTRIREPIPATHGAVRHDVSRSGFKTVWRG